MRKRNSSTIKFLLCQNGSPELIQVTYSEIQKQGLVVDFPGCHRRPSIRMKFYSLSDSSHLFLPIFHCCVSFLPVVYWSRKCIWCQVRNCGFEFGSITSSCQAWGRLFNLFNFIFLNHKICILNIFASQNYCEVRRMFQKVYRFIVMGWNMSSPIPSVYTEAWESGPQKVTVCEGRAFKEVIKLKYYHVVVQSPSRVWLFSTLWTIACQTSLSLTISQSLPKFMSIALAMPSSHLILTPFTSCLLSFPASGSFPMSRLFTSGGQNIGASGSASVLLRNKGLITFKIDWFDLLAVQGTLKSLLQHHSLKTSVLISDFFIVQLSQYPRQMERPEPWLYWLL